MKEEVDKSASHFDEMDLIDRAQQDAIEAVARRIDTLTWVVAVSLVIFISSILIMVASK